MHYLKSTWPLTFRFHRYNPPCIPGGPQKKRNSRYGRFFRTLLGSTVTFFTLLDRASFPHYNNTTIIIFAWELFILWVISYGLSFSGFARFPEFWGTINDSFIRTCANTYMYQRSTSYKEISVPMTCLDCKYLLGNTQITEPNNRSIYGRPKLSLIMPREQNPEKSVSRVFFGHTVYCISCYFREGFIFANFASQTLAKISTSIHVYL